MSNRWTELQDVDRVVHESARLVILGILTVASEVDFTFPVNETGLTKGNLSSHLSKLEEAGYMEIAKTFKGKIPLTIVKSTRSGRNTLLQYRKAMLQALNRQWKKRPA